MIYSMSGFGRVESILATSEKSHIEVSIELKSVNSKYCDIYIKCPGKYGFLEEWIRTTVRKRLSRGKIDVLVTINESKTNQELEADFSVLDSYHKLVKQIEKRYKLKPTKDVGLYLAVNGAFSYKRSSLGDSYYQDLIAPILDEALNKLLAMRAHEGEQLKLDIEQKLIGIEREGTLIDSLRQDMVKLKTAKMRARISELLADQSIQPDESFIAHEVAAFAERVDIEEEIVRLRTHVSHMRSLLASGGVVGRKLDFLAQEMLREANTIGSKSPDDRIAMAVVNAKSMIDRIKEQLQNIL